MAYASQSGRAKTSAVSPEAFGVCDRCGMWYQFRELRVQMDWRGPRLMPIGDIRVCSECYDDPQEQLRAITLPADPIPIISARPELLQQDSTDYFGTGQSTVNPQTGITQLSADVLGGATANDTIVPQPLGPNLLPNQAGFLNPISLGVDPNAQMTPVKAIQWAERIPITSIVANGTPTISINCSAPHGLTTGAQIAIWGTSSSLVYGIFTVIVKTATVFTVTANANVASGTVQTPTTIVATTNAGLPWSVTQVPQTGV